MIRLFTAHKHSWVNAWIQTHVPAHTYKPPVPALSWYKWVKINDKDVLKIVLCGLFYINASYGDSCNSPTGHVLWVSSLSLVSPTFCHLCLWMWRQTPREKQIDFTFVLSYETLFYWLWGSCGKFWVKSFVNACVSEGVMIWHLVVAWFLSLTARLKLNNLVKIRKKSRVIKKLIIKPKHWMKTMNKHRISE